MKNSTKRNLYSILKENSYWRKRESVSWKLNPNKLWLAKVSKRVFLEEVPNTWKSYTCELLVDASGSMVNWWDDNFKTAVETAKEIVSYFIWVIDINVTFFNVLEHKYRNRQVLQMGTSIEPFDKDVEDVEVDWKKIFIEKDGSNYNSLCWNWEVCNLVNAFEELNKKTDTEKIVIIVGDGSIAMDSKNGWWRWSESNLIDENYYIAGQPIKKYNTETYKATVDRALNNWIDILPITIWGDFYKDFFPETHSINNAEQVWELILSWLNEKFGRKV